MPLAAVTHGGDAERDKHLQASQAWQAWLRQDR
jgi:hypothetical protein